MNIEHTDDSIVADANSDQSHGDGQQKPPKVTYTPEQQVHLQQLIKDSMGRAARELRAERDALKAEVTTLRRTQTPPAPAEDLTLQLAETRAQLAALTREKEETAIQSALLSAVSGEDYYEPELAAQLLRSNVKLIEGTPTYVGQDGEVVLGSDLQPLSLKQAAKLLGESKPFLVKSRIMGGSGSTPRLNAPVTGLQVEDFYGPKATRGSELHKLSRFDPPAYQRLRAAAKARNLV